MYYLTLFVFANSFDFNMRKILDTNNYSNLFFSKQGYYSISVKDGDTINFLLNGGNQHLFFFIPFSSNIYIQDFRIDGQLIPSYSYQNFFCVEGNNNASFTFFSYNINLEYQTEFWIIPLDICYKSTLYVYGSNIIDILVRGTQLCVFSPTSDSKSQKYSIETGIPFNKGYHYTYLYTINYSKPDYIILSNDIQTHHFTTSNLVKYYMNYIDDDADHYYSIFYRRKTKILKYSKSETFCEARAITRCTSEGCLLDYVDFVSIKCNKHDIENIIVAAVIVGIITVIVLSLLVYFTCLRKKDELNDNKLNNEPLNNENENDNEFIYTQEQQEPIQLRDLNSN